MDAEAKKKPQVKLMGMIELTSRQLGAAIGGRYGATPDPRWSYRVAMVREKCLENEIFSRSGKSQGISILVGNLEKVVKVREKSGNLRIFKKVHC